MPLWLALLLKRQSRANILAPPWLSVNTLSKVLEEDTAFDDYRRSTAFPTSHSRGTASPPFLQTSTSIGPNDALPYHWLEMSHLLLESAADDIPMADEVRRLIRDVREARAAQTRRTIQQGQINGDKQLDITGMGGLEIAENRGFFTGLVDGLRKIGASGEAARREREAEEGEDEYGGDDSDESMGV